MDESTRQLHTLLDLDARHDELLLRLEELDRQVAQALAEGVAGRNAALHLLGGSAGTADPASN